MLSTKPRILHCGIQQIVMLSISIFEASWVLVTLADITDAWFSSRHGLSLSTVNLQLLALDAAGS